MKTKNSWIVWLIALVAVVALVLAIIVLTKVNIPKNNECIQKEDRCCMGENCFSPKSLDCEEGYTLSHRGCDEDCLPIIECINKSH